MNYRDSFLRYVEDCFGGDCGVLDEIEDHSIIEELIEAWYDAEGFLTFYGLNS